MTVKETWEKFIETTKDCCANAGQAIADVAKETWDLFKDDVIVFVQAVFSWLIGLIEGVCKILWNALVVVCAALLAAIKSTLGLVCEAVINWIKKL